MTATCEATALVRHYKWLFRAGLNDSHSGNASVRVGRKMLITPTGCCADTLQADQLVECSLDEGPPDGASIDAPLHLEVYRAVPDATAIIHSHGPHSIAVTLDGHDFLPPDFEGQYYFGQVPVLSLPYREYLERSPQEVAAALTDAPVVILRGHGVYARGKTLDEAYKWIDSLESSSRVAWLHRVYVKDQPEDQQDE